MTVLLEKTHQRNNFDCGDEALNFYLKHQASQDVKRKLSACFVYTEHNTNQILGYYTLSAGSIPYQDIPETFNKKLPSGYQSIPVILIGRLAVSKTNQGKGLGALLLIDALQRCYEKHTELGAWAIVVYPKNESAKQFYLHFGFITLPQSGKLFIPMKLVVNLFKNQ
ncbi:MAG: GNAT family N-acetyltransferase [Chitinophagaceae bacterium]